MMINGLTLKGIKHFEGREGIGLNATLGAADGKKVFAKVIDDASGGEMDIYWEGKTKLDMDKNKVMVETLARSYFAKHPKAGGRSGDIAVDLVNELDHLADIEKTFKKNAKKGYPVTLLLEYMDKNASTEEFLRNYTEDRIVGVRGWDAKVKAYIEEKFDHPKQITVFAKPEDFDFND